MSGAFQQQPAPFHSSSGLSEFLITKKALKEKMLPALQRNPARLRVSGLGRATSLLFPVNRCRTWQMSFGKRILSTNSAKPTLAAAGQKTMLLKQPLQWQLQCFGVYGGQATTSEVEALSRSLMKKIVWKLLPYQLSYS